MTKSVQVGCQHDDSALEALEAVAAGAEAEAEAVRVLSLQL